MSGQSFYAPNHTPAPARRFFGGQNPVGKRMGYSTLDTEIVGVVHDARSLTLRTPPVPMVYLPIHAKSHAGMRGYYMEARVSGDHGVVRVGAARDEDRSARRPPLRVASFQYLAGTQATRSSTLSDVANVPGQSRGKPGLDGLLHGPDPHRARAVRLHAVLSQRHFASRAYSIRLLLPSEPGASLTGEGRPTPRRV